MAEQRERLRKELEELLEQIKETEERQVLDRETLTLLVEWRQRVAQINRHISDLEKRAEQSGKPVA
jgi:hypothetical protein